MDPRQFHGNPLDFASSPTDADGQGAQAPTQPQSPPAAGEPEGQYQQQFQPEQQQVGDQQPGESNVDYEARLREAEEARQRAEQQAAEAQRGMQQIAQGLQQFRSQQQAHQAQQQQAQQRREIFERAQNMSPADGFRFIQSETDRIEREYQQQIAWAQQQAQQQIEAERRMLGTPLYADELVRRHNLPAEYKERLLRIGDPDAMARIAPDLAEEHQRYNKLQEQLNQLSRSQRAEAMRDGGLGMVGGGTGQGSGSPSRYSDDPDIRAMQIYAQLENGTYRR